MKESKRVLNSTKDVPTHFLIIDQDLAFGVNPFKKTKRHASKCRKVANRCDAFFLAPISNRKPNSTLLKRTSVGKNNFAVWFRKLVQACNMKGLEYRQHLTQYGLLTTKVAKLQRLVSLNLRLFNAQDTSQLQI